jgi:hypothetical protein
VDVRAVQVEVRESIAHVTLTQPDRGNPFDQAFCSQLCEAAIERDESPGVRAILIRTKGRYSASEPTSSGSFLERDPGGAGQTKTRILGTPKHSTREGSNRA